MKNKSYLFRFTTDNLQQLRLEGCLNMYELGRRAGMAEKKWRGYLYVRNRNVELGRHPRYSERVKRALSEHASFVESVIGSGLRPLTMREKDLLKKWGMFHWSRVNDFMKKKPPRVLVCHIAFVRWLIGEIPDLSRDIQKDQKQFIKARHERKETVYR